MPNEIQDSNQLQNIREPETPILKKRLYKKNKQNGQLKIGDHWNAITIIALSQSSPLKAVAEFVENSIDAQATQIIIYRGKESGEYYLKIVDNGNGIPRNDQGQPNFQYVATHICDSIKRQLKAKSTLGVQGEFGIGLLSFWTVGEELIIRSVGNDNKIYQMNLKKGNPKYEVTQSRSLFLPSGTELIVRPLLKGLKQLNGEKLQWYLASELRNRILKTGVDIRIIDRVSRAEFKVEPKKYDGRKLGFTETTELKAAKIQFELYLNEPNPENKIALYRMGTRVLESITEFDFFQKSPWNLGFIQGYIDAPLLQLSPANRLGIIRDEAFETFCDSLKTIEEQLEKEIQAQKKAEDEKATHDTLSAIQKALKV
ncbi:MAG: ATP-binding protein [Deltaproteobacteria bacterium]|nr:ATP-binding protein [Deltaproteobacteria bacterium]